ncbi:MAG: hypothetical protein Q8P41_30565 [Pseudomonadota bacterium]|nr:hypothetical protein [Pseudomonadota bacterium]
MSGLEYHSNIYLADGREQDVFGALAWVVKPEVELAFEGEKLTLDFGAGWGIKKFFDFQPQDDINLQNADRFTDFNLTFGVMALPKSVVGLRLDDRFEIQNQPGELPTADGSANMVHLSNDANGGITLRPGSALEIDLLGNIGIDRYTLPAALIEDVAGKSNINNRANYGPVVNARWRFLPKTSLTGNFSLNWTSWDNNLVYAIGPEADGVDYGQYLGKPNALAWRTMWGVRGQFTSKLAAGVEAGYGQMYYDEDTVLDAAGQLPGSSQEIEIIGEENFARDLTSFSEGLLVNAQVAYAPIRNHKVTLGYRKDFQDAFFTNYVAYNYLFLRYEGLVITRLGLTGEITYRIDAFHGEIARDDQNVGVKLGGAWNFNDALSAGLSVGWNERACLDSLCEEGKFYATQYDDFWALAGLTFTY